MLSTDRLLPNLAGQVLLAFAFLFSSAVFAQNSFDLEDLNPGEILVNLSVNEQVQVEQDTLHANLSFVAQGRDRADVQDQVNRKMTAARDLLEDSIEDNEVEYSIQRYNVYQVSPNRPVRGDLDNAFWRAQQSLQLTSQDSEALLDLVAELQEMELTMNGLNYSLSPQRYEEISDSLMEAALVRLQGRAEAAAAALDKSGVELVEITINQSNNSGFARRAMALSMEAAADVATPVAEPGLTTVTFNVSGRAILLP